MTPARDPRRTSTRLAAALGVVAAACGAAACASSAGSDYLRADLELPAAMPGASAAQAGAPREDWWRSFQDAELNRLVAAARDGNLGLVAMEARIRAARAVARRSGSEGALRLDANAAYSRTRASENGLSSGSGGGVFNPADPVDVATATLDASWELDLFGRIRRGTEAAWADAAAVEEDRRAVEVALVADVADAWFDVGTADAETTIHRETIDLLEKTLKIVGARVEAGLVSELDLRRTEGDLSAARSRLPDAERRRAVSENRLSLLLGKPPGVVAKGRVPASFDVVSSRGAVAIPVGLPAQLLDRRPDIRAAERRLVATNARVGQAVADFWPRVRLLGGVGFSAIEPEDLPEWGSRIWSIAPSVSLPILDGGEREFRLLENEALRDEAAADWMETILRALNEVGDAMVSLDAAKRTREAVLGTLAAETRSVELADIRYREGVTGYLDVLDAQQALAVSKLRLLLAERAVLTNVVNLHRALGGGWTGSDGAEDDPPSEGDAGR